MMIEEWVMAAGIEDSEISITAAQIWRAEDTGPFLAKVFNLGGGATMIEASGEPPTTIRFQKPDERVGDIVVQTPLEVRDVTVGWRGGTVVLFPSTCLTAPVKLLQGDVCYSAREQAIKRHGLDSQRHGFAHMRFGGKTHKVYRQFEWAEPYIQGKLGLLMGRIRQIAPESVSVMFGHVHSDRDPDDDQSVGAFIGGVLGRMLMGANIGVETHPMCDNYHTADRIDYGAWASQLARASSLPITEVQHEASLMTRHLGNELIIKLMTDHPERIIQEGGNVYFDAGDDMIIELYDQIGDGMELGRQACVPFQAAWEMIRWDGAVVNAYYRDYLLSRFPDSMVAGWWRAEPSLSYQELTHKYVYSLPPEEREELKARKNAEIDQSFGVKIGAGMPTPMLDHLLARVDLSRVMTVDVLEGFYTAQFRKYEGLMRFLGIQFPHWRVSFDRGTGAMEALPLRAEDAV